MKPTISTLFAGAGGCELGAIAAGFEPCESVEFDPRIAELHKANIGGRMHVKNILDCDPFKFEKVDLLHASPVCKQFSAANANKGEQQLDIDCAKKTAEFITVIQPRYFTLENVQAYVKSKSFSLIVDTLYKCGYWLNYQVLNSADFGVPQSRRRLILMAAKDKFMPPLPPKERRIGWYEAIADLVWDLPDTELADWQWKALPNKIKDRLKSPVTGKPKALLIENTGARSDRPLQTRNADDPCWTLRAMGHGSHWHRANALLGAKIKALDIACLARLQSFPDSYRWSGTKSVDGMGIGNSVPPLLYEKLLRTIK